LAKPVLRPKHCVIFRPGPKEGKALPQTSSSAKTSATKVEEELMSQNPTRIIPRLYQQPPVIAVLVLGCL
jgi:hypothetical protein